jgi:hypothetical protein
MELHFNSLRINIEYIGAAEDPVGNDACLKGIQSYGVNSLLNQAVCKHACGYNLAAAHQ